MDTKKKKKNCTSKLMVLSLAPTVRIVHYISDVSVRACVYALGQIHKNVRIIKPTSYFIVVYTRPNQCVVPGGIGISKPSFESANGVRD